MSRDRPAYPWEFRRQAVELVRAGRTPEEWARGFEPSASRSPGGCAASVPGRASARTPWTSAAHGTCEAPPVHAGLGAEDAHAGRKRVGRPMREAGAADDPLDGAMCGSVLAPLACERVDRRRFDGKAEA